MIWIKSNSKFQAASFLLVHPLDGSKQTDRMVQIGQILSIKYQNQPPNCSKGSGTTRSPSLFFYVLMSAMQYAKKVQKVKAGI